MNNYKITNLRTNKDYFLNDHEMINFFNKNKVQNYNILNLTDLKRKRANKILDTIAFVSFFVATVLSTILIIEYKY